MASTLSSSVHSFTHLLMHLILTEFPLSAGHGLFPGLGMGLGLSGQESGAKLSLPWGLKPGARQGDEDWALSMCGNVT